ncbi:MAG: MFS transporter [Clostridia bacterium]|nr:MFS transporter [Clostridia bacterium]
MATLLLIVIYLLFIGLGIPDSLFGTAWPAIYPDLGLPVSSSTLATLCTVVCSILSSLFAEKVIRRFGTAITAAVSTAMTAVGLIVLAYSQDLWWFCLCAIPLGLGAGAVDTAMNNYVALHYGAMQMSFLHCFYGVGVTLSPYLMSLVLAGDGGWRGGYRLAFCVQAAITLIAFLSFPLWKRMPPPRLTEGETVTEPLSTKDVVKDPAVRTVWFVFISSCGIEYVCASWGATFLVHIKELSVEAAAEGITFYYIGLTLGRLLSGFLAKKFTPWKIIGIGQVAVAGAILLFFLPLPTELSATVAVIALFLVGLGNGPLYPNMMHLTPENFGVAASQAVVGTQVCAAYVGMLGLPLIFGVLVAWVGAGVVPVMMALLYAILIGALLLLRRLLRMRHKVK